MTAFPLHKPDTFITNDDTARHWMLEAGMTETEVDTAFSQINTGTHHSITRIAIDGGGTVLEVTVDRSEHNGAVH